jgi:hypothetical protein
MPVSSQSVKVRSRKIHPNRTHADLGTLRFAGISAVTRTKFRDLCRLSRGKFKNLSAVQVALEVRLNLLMPGCYPSRRIDRGSGEIGRRARLRGVWGNPCRFKSCLPQFPSV